LPDSSASEAQAEEETLPAVPAGTHSMTRIPIPGEGGLSFFGIRDRNLRSLEHDLGLTLASRGDILLADGPEDRIALLGTALEALAALRRDLGQRYRFGDLRAAIRILGQDPGASLREYFVETVVTPTPGKIVRPRSLRQLEYIRALRAKELVLAVGPAGTGKTWLAMAVAVEALRNQQVRRIVLTRPAVEAGEKLGFLPGDVIDKVDPYLRPLYDALHDMMDAEKAQRLRERGVIEIAPIAFMRGRTLNDAFIILDEAQNTTSEQMKMFLTRMGFGSKAVITGDVTQIDLPAGRVSGLVEAIRVVRAIDGVATVHFDERDVVRHPLVQAIVKAYESATTDDRGGSRLP
jgi:phosphate starvation-inducible PhoH-like protein